MNNEKKSVAIIGGGISGLTAGIYALKEGFDVTIYEKLPYLGGLCTGWDRQGYHLDGCIHWLTGTKDNTDLSESWKTIGAFSSEDDFIYQTSWGIYEYEGIKINVYCDLNKLEEELIAISPIDEKEIKHFTKMVQMTVNIPLPLDMPVSTMNLLKLTKVGLGILPYLKFYLWSSKETCQHYAKRFKHPALRYLINHMQIGPGSLYPMLYSFGTVAFRNGGFPKGGSKAMTERIAKRYMNLGGKIVNNAEVESLIIKNKTVEGMTLKNKGKVTADYFISCTDAYVLFNNILKGKYYDKYFTNRLLNPKTFTPPSCFLMYFSINKKILEKEDNTLNYSFPIKPIRIGNRDIDMITIHSYSFDKYFDVGDNTVISVLIDQYALDYSYWQELYKDKGKYLAKKLEIVDMVKSLIENRFPSFKGEMTYLDSYSPATLNRYVGAYRGGYMSFMMNKKSPASFHNGKIKGLKNLYFASQWAMTPGGLPLAMSSGKFAVQHLLKDLHRPYIFSKPLFVKYTR